MIFDCQPWHVKNFGSSGTSSAPQVCSVLFLSHPWSEGWPHHGRTFSIYLYPLSFWLTLPQKVLSTTWCGLSRPCVVFLACVHLALFCALFLSPGSSLVSSWCDHSMLASLFWQSLTVPSLLQLCWEPVQCRALLAPQVICWKWRTDNLAQPLVGCGQYSVFLLCSDTDGQKERTRPSHWSVVVGTLCSFCALTLMVRKKGQGPATGRLWSVLCIPSVLWHWRSERKDKARPLVGCGPYSVFLLCSDTDGQKERTRPSHWSVVVSTLCSFCALTLMVRKKGQGPATGRLWSVLCVALTLMVRWQVGHKMSLPLVSKGSVGKHVDKKNHDVLAD